MKDTVRRFSSRAQAYAAFRPAYPAAAIDAALEGLGDPHALTIADIGAGTGIASRLFAQRGAAVFAIEPNARMRAAAASHQAVRWREGTAEGTGLGDADVDMVVACQAFHWFATEVAMQEFRRVARRRAAILQYERDESDAFTAAYGDVVRAYATDDTEALRAQALRVFLKFPNACVASMSVSSAQPLDRDALWGRASSASYLPSSGPSADRLRRDLHALFKRFECDGLVRLIMQTFVIVADW